MSDTSQTEPSRVANGDDSSIQTVEEGARTSQTTTSNGTQPSHASLTSKDSFTEVSIEPKQVEGSGKAPDGATVVGMEGGTPIVRLHKQASTQKRGRFTLMQDRQPEQETKSSEANSEVPAEKPPPPPPPPVPPSKESALPPVPNKAAAQPPAPPPKEQQETPAGKGAGTPGIKKKGRFLVSNANNDPSATTPNLQTLSSTASKDSQQSDDTTSTSPSTPAPVTVPNSTTNKLPPINPPPAKKEEKQPTTRTPVRTQSQGGRSNQTGLGKVFYFLDQMKLEVTDADKTIKQLQSDMKHMKERNKQLEAQLRDSERKAVEEKTLRETAERKLRALRKKLRGDDDDTDEKRPRVNSDDLGDVVRPASPQPSTTTPFQKLSPLAERSVIGVTTSGSKSLPPTPAISTTTRKISTITRSLDKTEAMAANLNTGAPRPQATVHNRSVSVGMVSKPEANFDPLARSEAAPLPQSVASQAATPNISQSPVPATAAAAPQQQQHFQGTTMNHQQNGMSSMTPQQRGVQQMQGPPMQPVLNSHPPLMQMNQQGIPHMQSMQMPANFHIQQQQPQQQQQMMPSTTPHQQQGMMQPQELQQMMPPMPNQHHGMRPPPQEQNAGWNKWQQPTIAAPQQTGMTMNGQSQLNQPPVQQPIPSHVQAPMNLYRDNVNDSTYSLDSLPNGSHGITSRDSYSQLSSSLTSQTNAPPTNVGQQIFTAPSDGSLSTTADQTDSLLGDPDPFDEIMNRRS